jgi:hypothetical protein
MVVMDVEACLHCYKNVLNENKKKIIMESTVDIFCKKDYASKELLHFKFLVCRGR